MYRLGHQAAHVRFSDDDSGISPPPAPTYFAGGGVTRALERAAHRATREYADKHMRARSLGNERQRRYRERIRSSGGAQQTRSVETPGVQADHGGVPRGAASEKEVSARQMLRHLNASVGFMQAALFPNDDPAKDHSDGGEGNDIKTLNLRIANLIDRLVTQNRALRRQLKHQSPRSDTRVAPK